MASSPLRYSTRYLHITTIENRDWSVIEVTHPLLISISSASAARSVILVLFVVLARQGERAQP